MIEVSVVVPLYGTHRGCEVLPAVVAGWLAQDVACEVLVATAGHIPLAIPMEATEAGRVRVVAADEAAATPGILRNLAAARARGPMLYLGDADVVPLRTDFLRRAIALAGAELLCQPFMHRLLDCGGAVAGGPGFRTPGAPCCFVVARPDGCLQPAAGERFRIRHHGDPLPDDEVLAVLAPPGYLRPDAAQRQQWVAAFHWGGVLLDHRLFTEVGGYCPRYAGWGSEDDDLLVKLAGHRRLVRAWKADRSLVCLHFEHERQDLAAPEVAANRALFAARLAAGPAAMAAEDRTTLAAASGGAAHPGSRPN